MSVHARNTGENNTNKRWFNGLVQNRWFILACACAIIAVQGGFFMSFGSLFVDLLEEFNEPRAQTAAILSVYNAVNLISGFFVGFMVDRYGPRTCAVIGCFVTSVAITSCYFAKSTTFLIISYGGVAGLFSCFFLFSGMKSVSTSFQGSTKMLALSLYYTCTPVAGIPYPYFLRYLSDNYGIQKTFLITGLFTCICIFLGLAITVPRQFFGETVKHAPTINDTKSEECQSNASGIFRVELKETQNLSADYRHSEHNVPELTKRRPTSGRKTGRLTNTIKILVSNVPFDLFAVGQALSVSSFRIFSVLITDILKDSGFIATEATLAYMVFNFSAIPGRLLPGIVSKLPMGSSSSCVTLVTFLSAPAVFGLNFVTGHELAVVICAICGLAFGVVFSANAICITRLVDSEYQTPAVGMSCGVTGIVVAVTGPLSGSLRDSSTSYIWLLISLTIAVMSASVMYFLSFILKRRIDKKNNTTTEVAPIENASVSKNNDIQVCTISTKL